MHAWTPWLFGLFIAAFASASASADQVFTLEVGAADALVCVGTPDSPARYGAITSDKRGQAPAFFPTRESNLAVIDRFVVRVDAGERGGLEVSVLRADLPTLSLPALDPDLSVSCGNQAPQEAEALLNAQAVNTLRRLNLEGWPHRVIAPDYLQAQSVRLGWSFVEDELTADAFCNPDEASCVTNAGALAHSQCCEVFEHGFGCGTGRGQRQCRDEFESMQARYFSLYSWAVEPGGPSCAPSGSILHDDDVAQCCGARYRSMSAAELVLTLSAAQGLNAPEDVDWAELYVCDPGGNRWVLTP